MPVLVVQMGHCYRTTGATGTSGEQAFATAAANACVSLLNGRNGWTVRKILADEGSASYRGDAFVAIHCDGSTSAAARGASVGYRTPEGQAFGQAFKRAYAARGWPGFRPDNYTTALAQYYGTGTAVSVGNRRAVIVECGFLTNPEDRALLTGTGGPERVALSIGEAIGISTQEEEDMTPEQDGLLRQLVNQFFMTDLTPGKETVYDAIWKNRAMLASILAAQQDDLHAADVLAHLDAGIGELKQELHASIAADLSAIKTAIETQNADEAARIVSELANRLKPAA